jgi:GNAT superfamily N-acetyltransferase
MTMSTDNIDTTTTTCEVVEDDFLSRIEYRTASPTDILRCVEMVKKDPTPNELLFASKNELQYRQHHAARYFRCAVYQDDDENHENGEDRIIGFITAIRVKKRIENDDELERALAIICPHDSTGPILAIRSVIIAEEYRNKGLGKAMMKDYVNTIRQQVAKDLSHNKKTMTKIVGLCWGQGLLNFYINSGFSVQRADKLKKMCTSTTTIDQQEELQQAYHFDLSLVPLQSENSFVVHNRSSEFDCYIVDSFAAQPGTGNPAAVVILPESFDPTVKRKWMLKVAAEFNLGETAFCWPVRNNSNGYWYGQDGDASPSNESHWNIRYFTPTIETTPRPRHADDDSHDDDLGHDDDARCEETAFGSTLASAAILYQALPPAVLPPGNVVVFHASEDVLRMRLAKNEKDVLSSQRISKVCMDFSPKPPSELSTRAEKATVRNMLKSAFSTELEPLYVGLSDMGDLLVELSPQAFSDIGYDSLNYKAFLEWDGYYRGIVICCIPESVESDDCDEAGTNKEKDEDLLEIDFLSRFFAPKAGINEDPVTGSAHCSLGPYFAQKLKKDKVVGRQMSVRSGIVECQVEPEKVTLTGTAITTMIGKLLM